MVDQRSDSGSDTGTVSRRSVIASLGAGSGIALAGCTSRLGGGSGETFKVGVNIPMSGLFSQDGSLYRHGFDAWEKKIEDQGGLDGHDVEILYRDNESRADRSAKIASQFVDEGVHLMIPAYVTDLTRASIPPAERARIPVISSGSTTPGIHVDSEYAFEFMMPEDRRGQAKLMADSGIEKCAIWSADTAPSRLGHEEFVDKWAPKWDLEVVFEDFHEVGAENFEPFILKAQNNGAEGVVMQSYGGAAAPQLRQIDGSDWEPTYVFQLAIQPGLAQQIGVDLVKNVTSPTLWHPSLSFNGHDTFLEKIGEVAPDLEPDLYAPTAYSVMQVFEAGVRELGEDAKDGETLRDWIAGSQVETINGPSGFDDNGIQVEHDWRTTQFQGEDLSNELVHPYELKSADFDFPKRWG